MSTDELRMTVYLFTMESKQQDLSHLSPWTRLSRRAGKRIGLDSESGVFDEQSFSPGLPSPVVSRRRPQGLPPRTLTGMTAFVGYDSDLVNQAYGLTPTEIDLMWKTAPRRMPVPPPFPSSGFPE